MAATLAAMHHSDVIAAAAANLSQGQLSLRMDPLWRAAADLAGGEDQLTANHRVVVERAQQVVAAQLEQLRGFRVNPERWTDGCMGWDSGRVVGLLGVVASLNQPKGIEP